MTVTFIQNKSNLFFCGLILETFQECALSEFIGGQYVWL